MRRRVLENYYTCTRHISMVTLGQLKSYRRFSFSAGGNVQFPTLPWGLPPYMTMSPAPGEWILNVSCRIRLKKVKGWNGGRVLLLNYQFRGCHFHQYEITTLFLLFFAIVVRWNWIRQLFYILPSLSSALVDFVGGCHIMSLRVI